ncbi:unnamed protein product [Miscanthus lutarioriparius]|uniref:Endonuclease/exonuclease/phosphatase domain-containing protein n=1 Tax=Miscanthus lutarioriparius TaxID=422564 RepID=A0A811SCM2_9POAL|nr:unnamed protein product [Miscanthus lutarioriparius]
MGVNLSKLELEDYKVQEFCISMSVRDRISNFRWLIVMVYGPSQHDKSRDVLYELSQIYEKATLPIILGGDFNLIREISDKNSDNHNQTLMDKFNDFIGDYQLRELKRSGQKYTWTNKQENLVLVNLDRVFSPWGGRKNSLYLSLGVLL